MDTESPDAIKIRDAGLKVTKPRLEVLDILAHSQPHHLSLQDIQKALRERQMNMGPTTLYRVLDHLVAAQLVQRNLYTDSDTTFELFREAHDHMIDLDTNEIIEFTHAELEALKATIADAHGNTLINGALILYVRKTSKSRSSEV